MKNRVKIPVKSHPQNKHYWIHLDYTLIYDSVNEQTLLLILFYTLSQIQTRTCVQGIFFITIELLPAPLDMVNFAQSDVRVKLEPNFILRTSNQSNTNTYIVCSLDPLWISDQRNAHSPCVYFHRSQKIIYQSESVCCVVIHREKDRRDKDLNQNAALNDDPTWRLCDKPNYGGMCVCACVRCTRAVWHVCVWVWRVLNIRLCHST